MATTEETLIEIDPRVHVASRHDTRFSEVSTRARSVDDRSLGTESRVIAACDPLAEATEALRGVRTALMLRWFSDTRKTLAVSEARSGEGSAPLAANLAVLFAQLGRRTLLIDANLRNPTQHLLFGVRAGAGLAEALANRSFSLHGATPVAALDSLSLMQAGVVPSNAQELLGGEAFRFLVETAAVEFDVVIIDTSAVLDSADAQIVSACAGGCLFAIRRHETRVADFEEMRNLIAASGSVVVGAVVAP